MQIWLDTIDLETVKDASKTGILSGITTNPSILSKTKNIPETLSGLLQLQKGPVAVQVTSKNAEDMIEEGRHIFDFSERMIVKVPVNKEGLIAIHQLCEDKIPVLGTGIFTPTQALLAANLGASYIAPYFCHIGTPEEAVETLQAITDILKVNGFKTKVLAASLRSVDHIIACARLGIAAATIKEDLYYKLTETHPACENFSQKFLTDWQQTHGNNSLTSLLPINKPILKKR